MKSTRGIEMNQLNFFNILAQTAAPNQEGTYFVFGRDAYKRTENGWLKLDVVLSVPIFGYRNLRTGWQLMQPDYVGSHWIAVSAEELPAVLAAHISGEMASIDHIVNVDMSTHDWNWRKAKRRSTIDGAVSVGRAPGGGEIRLKKVPGRKAKWIYEVDIYGANGHLFSRRELGLWLGMMFFGAVEDAQRGVMDTYGHDVADTVQKLRDADSGKDFGQDRSWQTTTPEILAKKLLYAKKHMRPSPLSPEEHVRLLELNGSRNLTGKFDDDQWLNLGLDHLYAELVVRFLAFGAIEGDVWSGGPTEWEQVSGERWRKGAYFIQPAAMNKKGSKGRYVVMTLYGSAAPKVRGVFKDAERAMAAVDQQVLSKSFADRNHDGIKEDFGPIRKEIFLAGLKMYVSAQEEGMRKAA